MLEPYLHAEPEQEALARHSMGKPSLRRGRSDLHQAHMHLTRRRRRLSDVRLGNPRRTGGTDIVGTLTRAQLFRCLDPFYYIKKIGLWNSGVTLPL